jgi:DNA modification methylase
MGQSSETHPGSDWEGKSRIVGNVHPTQKPVEIFARTMRKHTVPGDICFEPFSGSGSKLIAGSSWAGVCTRWSWSRRSWMRR